MVVGAAVVGAGVVGGGGVGGGACVVATMPPLQRQTAQPTSVPVAPKVFPSFDTSWYGLSAPSALNSVHQPMFTDTVLPNVGGTQRRSPSQPLFKQSAPFGFARAVKHLLPGAAAAGRGGEGRGDTYQVRALHNLLSNPTGLSKL